LAQSDLGPGFGQEPDKALVAQSLKPKACHNRPVSHTEHKALSPQVVRCFVVTVSDTRTVETDASGGAICDLLTGAGHAVVGRVIVRDTPGEVLAALEQGLASDQADAVITTGGTGISRRDTTYEVVVGLLDKRIDGFGELFRSLSFQEIGASAMMSRACAGIAAGKIVIALPGSEHAVRLAMTRLVLPELGHLVREATR
jgi:molybdenum cofactor biosynthesis protein B